MFLLSVQKSANILLARDLTAKIADVGLAKILHKDYLSSLREVGLAKRDHHQPV